jgi:hypothetical protein
MASYIVMKAPGDRSGGPEEKMEVIRDGFSFWALLFPFIWLLWHRLWFEAILVLAAGVVAAFIAGSPGFEIIGSALAVLIRLYMGLESNNLRIMALRRRGWRDAALIEAGSRESAELRYVTEDWNPESAGQSRAATSQRPQSTPVRKTQAPGAGPALGLLALPDGR